MQTKKPLKSCHSRGTLYFFPAILPLVEIVPWLLGVIGALAGAAGFVQFLQKYRRFLFVLAVLLVCGAAGFVYFSAPDKDLVDRGSRLTQQDKLPQSIVATLQGVSANVSGLRSFGEIWSRKYPRQILSSPVVSEGMVVFGTYKNSIEAVYAASGTDAWVLPMNAPVFAMTLDEKGLVYSGEGLHETAAASFIVLRAQDGKPLWQREFIGHIEETPTIDTVENRVVTATGPGGIWSLDRSTGQVVWHQPLGHIDATALLLEGNLYIPAQPDEAKMESVLFSLDAKTGDIRWRLPLPGQPWGSPVADASGAVVYSTTGRGQIGVSKATDDGWAQAVSVSGNLMWQVDLPSMPLQPSAYLPDAGLIIHTLKNGMIVALDVKDGHVVWQVVAGEEIQSAATLITGLSQPLLAVTDFNGQLTIRNALTGDELARRKVGGNVTASPFYADDTLYVASAYTLTAFGGVHALLEAK